MKRYLTITTVLLIAVFLLSACSSDAPKVGTVVTIPEGTNAYQVKQDRTGLTSCSLPAQDIVVSRNTYWETLMGSAGSEVVYISQVTVTNRGSCNIRSIFIKDEVLNGLIEAAEKATQ
jgi:hypothetical protein